MLVFRAGESRKYGLFERRNGARRQRGADSSGLLDRGDGLAASTRKGPTSSPYFDVQHQLTGSRPAEDIIDRGASVALQIIPVSPRTCAKVGGNKVVCANVPI